MLLDRRNVSDLKLDGGAQAPRLPGRCVTLSRLNSDSKVGALGSARSTKDTEMKLDAHRRE